MRKLLIAVLCLTSCAVNPAPEEATRLTQLQFLALLAPEFVADFYK